MSYILDSLKKSQKPVANVNFNEANSTDFNPAITSSAVLMKLIIPLSLLTTFIIGYISGNGLDVLQAEPINTQLVELKTTNIEEQPLAWPEGQSQLEIAQYFNNPKAFNEQQKAIKIAEAQKVEQQLQRAREAKKLAEQRVIAEQVKQVIAAQGYVKPDEQLSQSEPIDNETPTLSLDHNQLGDVSPELLEAFQSAIDEDNASFSENQNDDVSSSASNAEEQPEVNFDQYAHVKPLSQMPQWLQTAVPSLKFSLHMYSSDPQSSWLRLNDTDYFTGEVSKEGVVIESIEPQKVILQYQGQQFSLKALSNW